MVSLERLAFSGLYSFDADSKTPTFLDLTKCNVIVGPNNSGKSNILRIIQQLADSLPTVSRKLTEDEQHSITVPELTVDLKFSNAEAGALLNFLRIYRAKERPSNNEMTYVYDYKNFERLLALSQRARLNIRWNLGYFGTTREPTFTFELVDLGVQFHVSNAGGTTYAVDEFRNNFLGYHQDANLAGVLDGLAVADNAIAASRKLFVEGKNYYVIPELQEQYLSGESEERRRMLQDIFASAGIPPGRNYQVSFPLLLGSILRSKVVFTSGGTIFSKATLELDKTVQPYGAPPLASSEVPLGYTNRLEPDGWNLAQFLFSLKESGDREERTRFNEIKKSFEDLFPSLSLDVLPRYVEPVDVNRQPQGPYNIPHHVYIIVTDSTNSKQFELNRVGAGLGESLFLLAAAMGVENSVILLDEPATNLHPPQMKALMAKLNSTQSQIMVATHSPKLVHNLVFDSNASLFYVRRKDGESTVNRLAEELHFDEEDRYKLSYQIDTRVFFCRNAILCEGEADREFLERAAKHYGMEIDKRENIVVDVGSNGNFQKYAKVLNDVDIPFIVLTDKDNKDDNSLQRLAIKYTGSRGTYSMIRPDRIDNANARVFFFPKNLEEFLRSLDASLYDSVSEYIRIKEGTEKKPLIAHAFTIKLLESNGTVLDQSIRPLLERAFPTAH